MYLVALDSETELIEAGNCAPRLACLTLAREGKPPQIFGKSSASDVIKSYLMDDEAILIGHNIAFDFGVLGSHDEALITYIFQAYADGRVRETSLRETLILIREGRAIDDKNPKLDDLCQKYLGYALDKGADSVRYWYGDLMNVPLTKWTDEQKNYALGDAIATLNVFKAQQDLSGISNAATIYPTHLVSADEVLQTRAAWVLHLMRMWGFRTDGEMVALVKADLEAQCATAEARLLKVGLYKDKRSKKAMREGRAPDLSKDMAKIKARVLAAFQARGETPLLTEGAVGAQERGESDLSTYVSTAKDVLNETGDPDLEALAEIGPAQKALGTFIPLIEAGTKMPIIVRWNTIVRTGRTSCGGGDEIGNWQNPSKRRGIRESVQARPGTVLVKADYSLAELCSLSQVIYTWFGASRMREEIIAGNDLHLRLACNSPTLLGHMTYEEAVRLKKAGDETVDKKRGVAKNTNFGFPGGMGPRKFIQNAWANGVRPRIALVEAEALKKDWLSTWPEMRAYFDRVAREDSAGTPAEQLFSGRLRGFQPGDFCSRANTYFQGLTADGAKHMLWLVAQEAYLDKKSPLFGSRIILFVHDEVVLETPLDLASEAAARLGVIMKEAMEVYTPDVPASTEISLSDRWYKKAGPVYDAQKRLILWEPKCRDKACGRVIAPLEDYCPQHERKAA